MSRKRSWVDLARDPGRRATGIAEDLRTAAADPESDVPPEVRAQLQHAAAFVLQLQTWDAVLERWIPTPRATPPDIVGVGQAAEQYALQQAQDLVDDHKSGVDRVIVLKDGAPLYVVEPG